MDYPQAGSYCIYRIDNKDRITHVNERWLLFAQENDAAVSCHPDKIINRPIWEFIAGIETKHLYEIVLKKVRETQKSITLPFRCDAPSKRRFLELHITPASQGILEFASTLIREEPRDTVELLERDVPRADEFVRICSTCKKMELPGGCWVEVEDAVVALQLFEKSKLPQLTHGLCRECYAAGMAEADKL
jgi:hypothetical protein